MDIFNAMSHHHPSSKYLYCNQGGGRLKSCLKVACRRRDRWQQESGSGDGDLETLDSIFCILETGEREEVSSRVTQPATGDSTFQYHLPLVLIRSIQ